MHLLEAKMYMILVFAFLYINKYMHIIMHHMNFTFSIVRLETKLISQNKIWEHIFATLCCLIVHILPVFLMCIMWAQGL